MIYQSDFITDDIDASELYSGLGVKLHGAAMKLIKSSYAEFLHQKEHHPFSIFAVPNDGGFVIRVSALNDEAACIIEGFRKAKRLKIYGIEQPVRIVGENPAPAIRADSSGELIRGNSCRMAFVTPAMFKSQGFAQIFSDRKPQRGYLRGDVQRGAPDPFLHCLRREEVEIGAEFRRVKVELLNIPYLPLNIVGAVVGEAVHRIISDLAEFPEHPAVRVLAEVEVIVCVPLGLNPAVVFGAVGGVEFAVEFLAWFVYEPDPQDVRHEVAVIPQQERERVRVVGFSGDHLAVESLVVAVTLSALSPVRDFLGRVEPSGDGNSTVRRDVSRQEVRL